MNDKILDIIEREVGQKVSPETALDTLPMDSLEFMALIMVIDDETGISIPNELLGELHTVADILALAAA